MLKIGYLWIVEEYLKFVMTKIKHILLYFKRKDNYVQCIGMKLKDELVESLIKL